ncbi:hypothetical protein ACS0TY_029308 [Phlomoides rotata]
MSFRGRGRGRGGFGGGFRAAAVPFEPYPEIAGLGTAEYSTTHIQLIRWSTYLEKDCDLSPYYYEDRSERPKRQKLDIERFSDRQSKAAKVKPPIWDVIELSTDHMPAELARGGAKRVKKLKWTSGSDFNKLDYFEELERKRKGQDGTEKKEDEDEEEEELVGEEDEGEFSDEGDYEQAEYCDDDEDDFNMADDNDDEPCY